MIGIGDCARCGFPLAVEAKANTVPCPSCHSLNVAQQAAGGSSWLVYGLLAVCAVGIFALGRKR